MKLHIKRDSSKGMLGSVSFETTVRIETTPEESKLIQQYKSDKEIVFTRQVTFLGNSMIFNITVADLIQGKTFKSKNLYELIEMEDIIQHACRNLKIGTDVMSTFGREQIIEF
ncbi:MAG: hypothetical protein AAF846_23510 [Chloroflexota bacterium]